MLTTNDQGLIFKSEAELEKFMFEHLDLLLGLHPIAKQYRIDGEICDIIGQNRDENYLGIIELKNTEDRYIVQQLTRYYHGLIQQKPNFLEVNYQNRIKLIAIVPSFHKHNFIDRLYTKLELEFWNFCILKNDVDGEIYFQLTNHDTKEIKKLSITNLVDRKHYKGASTSKSKLVEIDRYDIIDYYTRLNYSSQLCIEAMTGQSSRERAVKYNYKCDTKFRIQIKTNEKQRFLTINLPSCITIKEFWIWVGKNVPIARQAGGIKRMYWIGSGYYSQQMCWVKNNAAPEQYIL